MIAGITIPGIDVSRDWPDGCNRDDRQYAKAPSPNGHVIDNKTLAQHFILPFGKNESDVSANENPESQQALIEVIGKCPPEDVGGFLGYYGFLDAMADPKHPEHDHLKDWYGGTFDPNQPETDKLKLEVLSLAKRWKPGKPRK